MTGSKKENIGLIATKCRRLVKYLEAKNNILLLTTSTRYKEHRWDIPKTTQLALRIKKHLKQKGKHVTVLDVANLRIHTCEEILAQSVATIAACSKRSCATREEPDGPASVLGLYQ